MELAEYWQIIKQKLSLLIIAAFVGGMLGVVSLWIFPQLTVRSTKTYTVAVALKDSTKTQDFSRVETAKLLSDELVGFSSQPNMLNSLLAELGLEKEHRRIRVSTVPVGPLSFKIGVRSETTKNVQVLEGGVEKRIKEHFYSIINSTPTPFSLIESGAEISSKAARPWTRAAGGVILGVVLGLFVIFLIYYLEQEPDCRSGRPRAR